MASLRECVGAPEKVSMTTRLVRCHAVTIAGVAMSEGWDKKWREDNKVMSDHCRCGEIQKMRFV